MTKEKFRQEELIRLLKWVAAHRIEWERICSDRVLSLDEYEQYLNIFLKEKLYTAVVMLVTSHEETIDLFEFFIDLGLQKCAEEWDEIMSDRVLNVLREKIWQAKESENKWKKMNAKA